MKRNLKAGIYTLLIILVFTIVPHFVGKMVSKEECSPCTWLAGFLVTILGAAVLGLVYALYSFVRSRIREDKDY